MKPASIKTFDRLYLGSIAVGLIGFALNYGAMTEQMNAELAAAGVEEMGAGVLIGGMVFGTAVGAALWFLVSILRIELVKWILALFAAYGVFGLLGALGDGMDGGLTLVFGAMSTLLSIAAIWFLFKPDAKAWFAEKRGRRDPE